VIPPRVTTEKQKSALSELALNAKILKQTRGITTPKQYPKQHSPEPS